MSLYAAGMNTIVSLPPYFNFGTLYWFTRPVINSEGEPISEFVTFDFRGLRFIDGSGLTVFCNTIEWLIACGVGVHFTNHDEANKVPISYLDSCGFFRQYLGCALDSSCAVRSTTLPFERVELAHSFGWLEYTFAPWISRVLGVVPEAVGSIRTCVGEIFNNIRDHSALNIGFVHAQHYPKLGDVRVTLSDFGRGIPSTIRERVGPMNDAAAILQASRAGVSAMSRPNNRGVGLDLLIDNVTANQGEVTIYSFSGRLFAKRGSDGRPERIATLGNGSYPGTLVDIRLRTDCFVGDDVSREELEW